MRGAFVTVDGTSAPAPGITLRNHGLYIRGDRGAHDVIVRGIRVRDAFEDGIQVAAAAYNVLLDHVSVQDSGDGNIDITQTGTRDVTVAWSILAQPAGEEKNMLLAFQQTRVTLHHDVFVAAQQRNPQVTYDDSAARRRTPTRRSTCGTTSSGTGGAATARASGTAGTANVVANFCGAQAATRRTRSSSARGSPRLRLLRRHDEHRAGVRLGQLRRGRCQREHARHGGHGVSRGARGHAGRLLGGARHARRGRSPAPRRRRTSNTWRRSR